MVEPRALRLGDLWIMCARTQVWHALEHNDADDAVDRASNNPVVQAS